MRWGLILSILIVIAAMVLAFGYLTNYPGHENFDSYQAGFVAGLIHGIIAPIMLIVSTFTRFTMYEINNTGFLYNIGFLLGLLLVWGGGARGTEHVVKNYYYPKNEKTKLTEEEHEHIGKIVEDRVNKKFDEYIKGDKKEKSKRPLAGLFSRIIKKKPDKSDKKEFTKKKSIFKEKEVENIKISKKK